VERILADASAACSPKTRLAQEGFSLINYGVMNKNPKVSDLGACEQCGRALILNKFTLCYECRHQEKLDVDRALDYLKTNRGATLNQVSQATGVDPQLVLKLIRGGRMEVLAQERIKKMGNLALEKKNKKKSFK
jgi:hypothetical protein